MLTLFLAVVLLPPQADCVPFPELVTPEIEARTWQKSGPGLWIGGIGFSSADIRSATPKQDSYTGEWMVQLAFTKEGNRKFLIAQRCGVDKFVEISFDRKLISRPVLNAPILGGEANITGGFTREEAVALAGKIASLHR